jgi:pimeloyl-ACP methyl ester carboxylesterase
VDRRGRGESGDVEPYAIEHEYEDIAAVMESIPGPVNLLGHSYGAICALEASLRTSKLRKLILYEPPIQTDIKKTNPPDAIARMNAYLQAGQRGKLLLFFLREIVGIPQKEIRQLKSLPGWSFRLATAHTIPREEASVSAYIFKPERFSRMESPTLLLLGGESPPFFAASIESLKRAIPRSRIAVMAGQGHAAMETSPELFLKEVVGFLTES